MTLLCSVARRSLCRLVLTIDVCGLLFVAFSAEWLKVRRFESKIGALGNGDDVVEVVGWRAAPPADWFCLQDGATQSQPVSAISAFGRGALMVPAHACPP